ncbi:MAG: dipeptidase, partial [Planctomycetes bacterium]|nr:dipeptidase [Planctomycetota bacterium]
MHRRHFIQSTLGASLAAASTLSADGDETDPLKTLQENLNPKIRNAREIALKILKPTSKQLEHGLRLHAESPVFDSYGFSPRAAVDGDVLAKAIEAGASDLELKDLREEMTMTRYVTDPIEQNEYLEAWRASGVTCIFQNAGEEGQDPIRLLKRLARFTYVTDFLRNSVSKAAVPDDILEAKQQNRHCLYMTGNGVPLTQHWVSVPDELRYLRV